MNPLSRVFTTCSCFLTATLLFGQAVALNNTLMGRVLYQSSGNKPAVGVQIKEQDSNGDYSKDNGEYRLIFQTKRSGASLAIEIGPNTQEGRKIELVNERELKSAKLPEISEDILDIIVCPAGQRDIAAQKYYRILRTTADRELEKKKKEIEGLLAQKEKDYQKISDLFGQLDRMQATWDSTKIHDQAFYIASINLDKASQMVKDAVRKVEEENDVEGALEILNEETLENIYQQASAIKRNAKVVINKADSEIQQVIEGYEFKISLLEPKFKYKEIAECYEKIAGIYENEEYDKEKWVNNIVNAATFWGNYGDYLKQLKFNLKAVDIVKNPLLINQPDLATPYANLAQSYENLGEYDKAYIYGEKALEIRKITLPADHPDLATSCDNLALTYIHLGEYNKAWALGMEALKIQGKIFGKEHPDYAKSLNILANLYQEMGRYESAEPLCLEAKAVQEKVLGKEHPEYAKSLNNLANVYFQIGRYETAETLYLEGKAIQEKVLGKEHPEYAKSLNNLANVYFQIGRYETAETLYLKAKAIQERTLGGKHPDYAKTLNNLANMYREMGRFGIAETIYFKTKEIQEETLGDKHPDYAKNINDLAYMYQEMGRYDKSERLYLESNGIQRYLILKSSKFLTEQEAKSYLKIFINDRDRFFSLSQTKKQVSSEFVNNFFDNILFYKGYLLMTHNNLKASSIKDTAAIEEFNLRKYYQRLLVNEYAKPIAERLIYVAELEGKVNLLEKEILNRNDIFRQTQPQVRWEDIRSHLQPDEAAIEFFNYRYFNPKPTDSIIYCALVLRPNDTTPHLITLFEEKTLKEYLKSYTSLFTSEEIELLYSWEMKYAGQISLYNLIWKPLEKLLLGVNKIYCSPSGLLNKINLGAIPVNNSEIFGEKHQLVTLISTRELVINNDITPTHIKSSIIIGGVNYNITDSLGIEPGYSKNKFPYLYGTALEAKNVNQILQAAGYSTHLYTGLLPTEELFKSIGSSEPSPHILHIASHGFYFPSPNKKNISIAMMDIPGSSFRFSDNPMIRSGLILAGGNFAWETGSPLKPDMEDGILTAYEISQMDLSNTELVVLAGSETGLGDIDGEEGVYGLQRAFKIAGVDKLLVSLWSIDDNTATVFITHFYQKMFEEKLNVSEAFYETQKWMRKNKAYSNPFYWAGFILIE